MADLVDNSTPAWKGRANEALSRFQALPTNKKVLLFTAIAAVLSIGLALLVFNKAPPYKVLFTGLADRDGGEITAALQQMNVPYQIGNGGVISVPSEAVYDTRLRLATQGLPKSGGIGFELMDKQKFGISQFAEQVNYQRSIEGELARTIQAVGVVDAARVHLAMPKQTVFVRDQQQPTASVMLTLRPGRILDGSQIAGIMYLVSSSVPNLPLRNVSIVDQDGNLLSTLPDANNGSLDRRQLDYVRQIEADYAKRVESILEPIFGKSNARAQVTASVDFSESEQTSETYRPNSSPNPSATRSQQINERLGNNRFQTSGVPGALTNQPPSLASAPLTLPPGAAPGTANLSGLPLDASGALSREITTNYEVDKTIQHTKMQKGTIKRLTAAVVVNYKMVANAEGVLKPTPLTEKEFAQINNLVKEAVGFNAQRGDSVNVVNASFADAVPVLTTKDKVVDFATENMADLFKYGLLLLAITYLLFGVVRPIMRDVVTPPPPPVPDVDPESTTAGGRLLAVAGEDGEAEGDGGEGSDPANQVSPKEQQRRTFEANMQNVRELVKNDPRMAAQIIKEWITSDE